MTSGLITHVLILDTETTGIDPKTDECIEVACALYHVPSVSVLSSYASLIHLQHHSENPAEHINGIPTSALEHAYSPTYVWKQVTRLASESSAILAHNAEFDQAFCPRWDIPWICTMGDVEWPKRQSSTDGLVKLALAHGLGVSHAHRAMVDVDLICRLLSRAAEMGFDLQKMLNHALRPKAKYISLEPYAMREDVKKAGFRWDAQAKVWHRTMAIEDAEKLTFKVKRI